MAAILRRWGTKGGEEKAANSADVKCTYELRMKGSSGGGSVNDDEERDG